MYLKLHSIACPKPDANIVLCGCEAFGMCVRAAYGLQERWRGKLSAGMCGTL